MFIIHRRYGETTTTKCLTGQHLWHSDMPALGGREKSSPKQQRSDVNQDSLTKYHIQKTARKG